MRGGAQDVPGVVDWRCDALPQDGVVAVDGQVIDAQSHRDWSRRLAAGGIRLADELDLPAQVWPDRPALPAAPVYEHQAPFACRGRTDKIEHVRPALSEHGAELPWILSFDDITRLLNLSRAHFS